MARYRWEWKGKTTDGGTVKLSGAVHAENERVAADRIEHDMRAEYPNVRWMHKDKVETENIKYGPTVWSAK